MYLLGEFVSDRIMFLSTIVRNLLNLEQRIETTPTFRPVSCRSCSRTGFDIYIIAPWFDIGLGVDPNTGGMMGGGGVAGIPDLDLPLP